jgi:catechol 2,3-dioxygenase-like lactoylglutathione lyase family enzyme
VLAHFIVSDDVERSRRFYTEVLGGRAVFPGEPTYVALSNSWIVINGGGGPTDDKPTVTLETPRDPDRVSSFLNIRVKDIEAVYAEWSARGAEFLTPPKQHQFEKRCYIRDPDGHLIEVGQTTDPEGTGRPLTGHRIRPPRSPSECRDHRRNPSHRRWPVPRTLRSRRPRCPSSPARRCARWPACFSVSAMRVSLRGAGIARASAMHSGRIRSCRWSRGM